MRIDESTLGKYFYLSIYLSIYLYFKSSITQGNRNKILLVHLLLL